MKLLTKEIDQKLFSQYNIGSDLENQMVVAKIFNPYGRGNWYLLNSDPNDPDYLWAIVDLFEVEIGSVSRSELESIKVPPFNLPLERDQYWEPKNAAEVFRGLLEGEQFRYGGNISDRTNYLSKRDIDHLETKNGTVIKGSQLIDGAYVKKNVRFEDGGKPKIIRTIFEEEEFEYAGGGEVENFKKGDKVTDGKGNVGIVKEVQANGSLYIQWTSYMGEPTRDLTADNNPNDFEKLDEYAKGGGVKERVYIEYLNKKKNFQRDIKYFDSYESARNWALKNFDKFNPDMIKYEYAKGGSLIYMSKNEYREKLEVIEPEELRSEVESQLGIEVSLEDVENNFDDYVDELVDAYARVMKSRGERGFAKGGGVGKSSDKYTVYLYYGRGQEPSVHKNVSLRTAEMLVMTAEHAEIVDSKGNVVDLSQYAEGGMATFDDKVKAISKRLEGSEVSPKYRKEYGKRYSKSESKTAARKIAGAMRAKEIIAKRKANKAK